MSGIPDWDADTILETLRASRGHVCVQYTGMERGWSVRWNPGRNGYEYVVTGCDRERAPEHSDADWELGTTVLDYIITTRREMHAMLADTLEGVHENRMNVVEYEDTPFPDAAQMAEGPVRFRTSSEREQPDEQQDTLQNHGL